MTKYRFVIAEKGGAGSGHHGHAGRPGKRGGSTSGTGTGGSGTKHPNSPDLVPVPKRPISHDRKDYATNMSNFRSILMREGWKKNDVALPNGVKLGVIYTKKGKYNKVTISIRGGIKKVRVGVLNDSGGLFSRLYDHTDYEYALEYANVLIDRQENM